MGLSRLLYLALPAALIGCASMSVQTDFDPEAGFGQLRTFGWMPTASAAGVSRTASIRPPSGLLEGRIRAQVRSDLEEKGYRYSDARPDFRVGILTVADRRVDASTVNTYYTYRRTTWIVSEPTVRQYVEGTLIIDLVAGAENDLVWRGSASGALPANPTPQSVSEKAVKAASAILDRFPPEGAR
ncbi:MAG: DUF4136 domain-containing protein [Gemmatimonadales bacterium]